ncbi:leucine-rich PPR motif-containing protein, mitochondrial [Agrilus planipennis]|uniref:Leucine-rich PPR motif-containing protein, mitochondrial n=1 Tax=Agrilus planipennis TaxID=224129 RepID=A0A1W4X312_AGRPL|nr:leucine-rich PPR motif-containing protein, mitochondrial [Agrilus planipennis]XP_018326774.1 leucine-rich PPR motif-containing protein, mitochondrial [Agrilus planipennis]
MSCILRSSKFARYIAGFARHVVINPPREFDYNVLGSNHCICQSLPRSLATQATVQHDSSLEYGLRKIDQGVRRTGRISRQDIEDILEELRNSRTATTSQSLLVIRCCGNLVPEELPETRTKLVQEIWQTLQKLNIPVDVSHYNALLRVYLENEYSFSPTEFLSEMESKGIEPNRVTYQRLIARYCQLGDIEGATRILEFMREKQLPVNESVFNALIMGHAQAGDMESAHGILAVMTQAGLEPTEDTYTTLLCGYAKAGDIGAIKKVLDECESKEIFLLDKDLLEVIYSLAISDHKDHVPFILEKTRKAIGYNQDAINTILRLINKDQDDVALMILKTMSRNTRADGTLQTTGNFIIKQLVKIGRSPEKIIEICNWLQNENLNDRGLHVAAETALQLTNEKIAYPILKEMKDKGMDIRPHYFWPLLVAKASDPTGDEIINVLQEMNKFNVSATYETIKDYVIPNLKCKSSEIISKLRQANISVGSSACNLVHSLLLRNDIDEAAIIASRVDAYYHPNIIKRPLTNAFYNTKDVNSYVNLLRHVYENLERRDTVLHEDEQTKPSLDKNEVIGSFILDLSNNRIVFPEIIEDVLKGIAEQGLSISNTVAEKIQDKLGENMNDNISKLLDRLTSGELVPAPLIRKPPSYVPSHKMNVLQLERLVENLKAKNQECLGQKRQLLTLYCRAKELEKAENLLPEMEAEGFQYSCGTHAQMIDLYCYHDKLDKALEHYEKFKEFNDEHLDNSKTLRLANLLIRNDHFDEGIALLESQKKEQSNENEYGYNTLCFRTLNYLAEQGKVKELQILFDTLFKNGYLDVNNMILGPLIKVHLINNDIQSALDKFEECCNRFKATPWKNELTCRLIQAEDAEKLQKLTDLSTSVHGEINSLYDLVFAFVECGRIRQARKILETPGLQSRTHKINNACQRYREEGLIKPLEGLKEATKDLNHINRTDIYHQLLLSYIKQNNVEKAQGLWMQMQEEDMAPTDQFLYKLGTFLKANNVPVPFTIPNNSLAEETTANERSTVKILKRVPPQKTENSNYWTAIKNGDLDRALLISKQKLQSFSTNDVSMLIEALVQKDRLSEATQLTLNLLDNNSKPVLRVFRFFLNKLSQKGDIETLQTISAKLNSDLKKLVSFDNRVCHAYLVAGKAAEYLDSLETELDQATDADLNAVAEKFPRGGAIGILEKCPELVDRFEKLAIKYAERGIVAPMNVLWSYYFTEQNKAKAEEIWNKYLQDSPRIMFQRVIQHARDSKDEIIAEKLIRHLKTAQVTEGALGNAYSCLLDILVAKEKNNEVVTTFEECLKDVHIENLNRTAVLRVKEVYTKLGRPFNYIIPAKKAIKSSSSSSNSSDSTSDEVEVKTN